MLGSMVLLLGDDATMLVEDEIVFGKAAGGVCSRPVHHLNARTNGHFVHPCSFFLSSSFPSFFPSFHLRSLAHESFAWRRIRKKSMAASCPPANVAAAASCPPANVAAAAIQQAMLHGARPVVLDYFADSAVGKVAIAHRSDEAKTKFLMKSTKEFTSNLQKVMKKMGDDGKPYYIALTENSLYVTSGDLKQVKVPEDFGDGESGSDTD
jgi:hypothetical protein